MRNDLSGLAIWNGISARFIDYQFTRNEWAHLTCVMTQSSTKFYVNGTFIGETDNGINTNVQGLDVGIGNAFPGVSAEQFEGEMNEIRIWNTARSADEIQDNYNKTVSAASPGLIVYYPIDENITSAANALLRTVKDYSSSNLDGRLFNYFAGTQINIVNVSENTRCANDAILVGFTADQPFDENNAFTLELSDATGDFTSPTILNTQPSTLATSMLATLPNHLANGMYKVRISSSSPAITGIPSGAIQFYDRPYAQEIKGRKMVNIDRAYNYQIEAPEGSATSWLGASQPIFSTNNSAQLSWNSAGKNLTLEVFEINGQGCIGETSTKIISVLEKAIDNIMVIASSICPGSEFKVRAHVTGSFRNNQSKLVAQLSNADGSFAKPVNIGSLAFSEIEKAPELEIPVAIPLNLKSGLHYRIRVIATRPDFIGEDNGFDITIGNPKLGIDKVVTKCAGTSIDISKVYSEVGLHFDWGGVDPQNITEPGVYTIVARNAGGCASIAHIEVKDIERPNLGENQVLNVPAGTVVNLFSVFNTGNYDVRWNTASPKNVSAPGNYRVIAKNESCRDTAFVRIVHNGMLSPLNKIGITGKSMETTSLQAKVYPNPATTKATLQLTGASANATVIVTDLSGKTMWTSTTNKANIALPVQQFAKGMYLVTITSDAATTTLHFLRQ